MRVGFRRNCPIVQAIVKKAVWRGVDIAEEQWIRGREKIENSLYALNKPLRN